MKFLIDTHVWVWIEADIGKISRAVIRRLQDQRNEIWFSPMSVFELVELERKQRLKANVDEDWVLSSQSRYGMIEAPVTLEIALEARAVSLPHHDPIDKLLVATARVLQLTLVTADRNIIGSKAVAILPAR